MSKRYGRNQKRAHRSRIADLEAQIAKLQAGYAGAIRSVNALGEEIACAKRIVGEYCVAFEPHTVRMSIKQTDFATVMQHERDFNSGVSRYWDFKSDPFMQPMRVEQIRLPIMCALADVDRLRMTRHVKVSYDNKVYAYAIDAAAWHMNRYPRQLVENVGRILANSIWEEMRKGAPPDTRRTHTRDEPDPRITYPNFNFGLPELPDFLR